MLLHLRLVFSKIKKAYVELKERKTSAVDLRARFGKKPQTNKLRNPSKGTFGAPSGTVPSLESEKRDNATEGDLWRPNPGQIFGL